MLLGEILKRGNNNLDLFRLIAACMVILGHAYALLPGSGGSDVIGNFLGFDYSGSLAVKIFFFISGMLVTSSLLQKQSIPEYISARFFQDMAGFDSSFGHNHIHFRAARHYIICWGLLFQPRYIQVCFTPYFHAI